MSRSALHLVVPGRLDQRTGGYIYDRRVAEGLRGLDWTVQVHSLQGCFPGPDEVAEAALEATLSSLPDASRVVVDGLALGGLPKAAARHAGRLTLLGLVHHPLYEETGLAADRAKQLEALERAALESCRGIVATSGFTAKRLREWLQPCPPLRVVTPGIEHEPVWIDRETRQANRVALKLFRGDRFECSETGALRAESGKPANALRAPMLLCVGSLVPRKGQDLLVQALDRLQDRSWHCLLAGSDVRDPTFAERLRIEIARRGLETRVEILGECPEPLLDALYQSADLFVLPAWYEGYGMAFAEAMAHGLPIIATSGGAIPDTVPATAGMLVTPGDIDSLTAAIARLLDEPILRAELARGAWDHARSLPGWNQVSVQFANALRELAGS